MGNIKKLRVEQGVRNLNIYIFEAKETAGANTSECMT